MNTKSLIIHQLKCEWLSFRGLVALWAIVLAWSGWMLFSWNEPWRAYQDSGIRQNEGIVYLIISFLVIIFAVGLFKRDDYREVRAFWQTRPMPEAQLYLAKFIFFIGIVAEPVTALFFINIWIYDSLSIAILSGIEILAWLFLTLGIVVLLMQHSAGTFSFVKPTILIGVAVAIAIFSVLAIYAWHHYISNRATLCRDYASSLAFLIVIILLAIVLNLLWLRHTRSRKMHTRFKHYLCIPIIAVFSFTAIGFVMEGLSSDTPDGLTLEVEKSSVSLEKNKYGYHGGIEIQLNGNEYEYLNRIVFQNLVCDEKEVKLTVSDSSGYADSANFVPKTLAQGKQNRDSENVEDHYETITLQLRTPLDKTIPKKVRIKGYCYVELAHADEILNTPFMQEASVKSNGMEFSWRTETVYHHPETIYIKRSHYPLLTYSYLRPRYNTPYCYALSKEEEYRPMRLAGTYARSLTSHLRATSSFRSQQTFPSERQLENRRWRNGSTLHIYQFNPTRIVKIPVDITLDLVHKKVPK